MAAAAIKHILPHGLHNHHGGDDHDSTPQQANSAPDPDEGDPAAMKRRESEKRKVVEWVDHKQPLNPDQIAIDPRRKLVGHSRHLRCEDFELIKTLGTGMLVS